jgi:hypothetical protein
MQLYRITAQDGKRGTVEEYLTWQSSKPLAEASTIIAIFGVPKRTAYNWRSKYKIGSEGD